MPLHEARCWGAHAQNHIGGLLAKRAFKITDKRALRIFIAIACAAERMLDDVHGPWRLAIEFIADSLRVLAPGLEIPAKGMDQRYAFSLIGCERSRARKLGEGER